MEQLNCISYQQSPNNLSEVYCEISLQKLINRQKSFADLKKYKTRIMAVNILDNRSVIILQKHKIRKKTSMASNIRYQSTYTSYRELKCGSYKIDY